MGNAYFSLIDEDDRRARYLAGAATGGPWDPGLQHGGPPNALAVREAERAIFAETGRTDLTALRVAAEFVHPVPVGEVDTQTQVLRAARSAALVEVAISAGNRPCLFARVWFVRSSDTSVIAPPLGEPSAVPDVPPGLDVSFPYGSSLEWRFIKNQMGAPGPAAAWVRPTTQLLDGEDVTGLARVALIADSASGLSSELDWSVWSFLNVDLDIHLARSVEGEWLLMDAATQFGPAGSALARSTLSDVRGVVGSSLQTLVVAPLPG